nr:coiled-coil alpha-helical rod protein 1 isoform X2 [Meriones unguiculatus]
MWRHSSGARAWADALLGNDPESMGRWCLDGLPSDPAVPWRELWRLSSLRFVQALSSSALSFREYRHLLTEEGNIDGWRQDLEASDKEEMLPPSGFAGLVPPSHFQARPFSTLSRTTQTRASDIPLVQSMASQDVPERRLDAERPTVWEHDLCGDGQGPWRRGRSLELEVSSTLTQQSELISRHLKELRRLEEEVQAYRETSMKQKIRLEAQAMELDALAVAEKAGQAEAEGLRAALAGAEMVRKNLEEGKQRELEEMHSVHQEQAHQKALASLTSRAEVLEESLNSLEMKRAEEVKQLAMAQKEVEQLRSQLSKTQEELEAQVTLVASLRKYVGEQAPPEVHSRAWERERKELLDTVQHMKEDRADLQATIELLQIRVQSLTHMLSLQEEELTRKIQPSEALEPQLPRKCRMLLRSWREKVFVLMVQLKAQDLQHRDATKGLKDQIAELQEQLTAQTQEQAILQRALQDRAAEVEVERMSAKTLQVELNRAQEARRRQEQKAACAEELLRTLVSSLSSTQANLHSSMTRLDQAVARIPSLNNRLSYAIRKVHTIKGLMARKLTVSQLRLESCPSDPPAPPLGADLSLELEQLREERNRLDAELQLSAQLIQQEVGRAREQGETERRQLNEVAQQLEQELRCAQDSLLSVGQQLQAARQGQQESTEEAACLRQELTRQQKIYGQALQEKVAEVETRLREQLTDTKRRLNEARREQAKAVVSLRQIQHKATREKERNQELRRLQDEARKEEGQRLARRVQELERDKNLMLQRLLAVLPVLQKKPTGPCPPPAEPPEKESPAASGSRESRTVSCVSSSLRTLFKNLQGLSEAISREDSICLEDNHSAQSMSPDHCC